MEIAFVSVVTAVLSVGFGTHITDIPQARIPLGKMRLVTTESTSVWTYSLPKLAVVALLERLLDMRPWTRALFGLCQGFWY